MDTGERIKEIIRYKGLNVKTFAELCGYDRPQVFYDLIKGKTRNVSSAMCARITAAVPEIDKVWLLTGYGTMLKDEPEEKADEQPIEAKMVPLVPISALAGPLSAYHENGVDLRHCQRVLSPSINADMALTVNGDSMEPVFSDGSTVFVKRINEAAFIPWGHTMVIDTENGAFIKNVMPDDSNDAYIWAESINPRYPRMHIPKSSIFGMYRVLNVLKTFNAM